MSTFTEDYGTPLVGGRRAERTEFRPADMQKLGVALGVAEGSQPLGEVRTELVPYPHPALTRVAQPCTDEMWDTGVIQELADALALVRYQLAQMKVDSYAVAAPQIAIPFRAFLWDNNGSPMALFNPEIVEQSLDTEYDDEQCLSFLGKYYAAANRFDAGLSVQVARSERVVVRGFTVDKEWVEVEAVDIVARMMLHEIDHLDGITMVDRIKTKQMRKAALARWYKLHPELKEPT